LFSGEGVEAIEGVDDEASRAEETSMPGDDQQGKKMFILLLFAFYFNMLFLPYRVTKQ